MLLLLRFVMPLILSLSTTACWRTATPATSPERPIPPPPPLHATVERPPCNPPAIRPPPLLVGAARDPADPARLIVPLVYLADVAADRVLLLARIEALEDCLGVRP